MSSFLFKALIVAFSAAAIVSSSAVPGARRDVTINARDFSECTTEDCVCGQTCRFAECSPSTGPTFETDDCVTLTNTLLARTGTFFVAAGAQQVETYGTCTYTFENDFPITLEYCWDDFANAGLANASGCETTTTETVGGKCGAESGLWFVQSSASA
ncbi:hypothetical protein SISSUDRAFT_1128260 [Sistotremastrum suecicum HHB10207 ss-3]|uniref:Uncharacterized protein n=1 Tax=Sistotremastrum suecicum HHB10207 ss-3 TaxID=1314776 RepID=A0A166E4U3_9AGAM|nr:hypothetical protein SISSUDRAFT_1128260 [Sistotremastrum suecicum HHB10207 ss-3]